jgi:Cu/Ag efflux protein CusF
MSEVRTFAGGASGSSVTPAQLTTGLAGMSPRLTTTATKTSAYTASANELVPADATSAGFTVTLPAAATATAGATVVIKKIDAGTNIVTISRAGSDTINIAATSTTLTAQDQTVVLVSDGTSKWFISSGLKSQPPAVVGLLVLAAGTAGVGGLTIGSDVNLYRVAADALRTDDALQVGGTIISTGAVYVSSEIRSTRASALNLANTVAINGEATYRYSVLNDGKMTWGGGAVATDTNLYRSGVNALTTDSSLTVTGTSTFTGAVTAAGVLKPGRFTTAARPTAASAGVGGLIYDTTLSKPIYSDGTIWRDAVGVAV